MALGSEHIGGFVDTPFGTGRLVAVNAECAEIQFFRAPTRSAYTAEMLDLAQVRPLVLAPHTRIYLHDGGRWRIGRIEDQHPSTKDHYLIAFPNSQGTVLPVQAFDVRWSMPVEDPYEILASVGGDSPLVYQARLDLLSGWTHQRRLAAGVEGLLLGSVELHAHQLEVVRRVSQDPIKRYLLADEVGLGKTIEASALIWQLLQRKPDGHVLILVPAHLRKQWAEELVHRFRADQFKEARVRIHSHEDAADWPTEPVDLLVIDEAHHVTRSGALTDVEVSKLTSLAHKAEELLLLSATPVRSNEAGFLDLLHLLDPHHYHPSDLDDFTKRVELRDQLALICQSLEPSLDAFDLSLFADELRGLFPDDSHLFSLLESASNGEESARPEAILRVREHLSESYRLHHRLVRTRREGTVEREFSVRGRKRAVPFVLPAPDGTGPRREALLNTVREVLLAAMESGRVTEAEAAQIFRDLAARCGSMSPALRVLLMEGGGLNAAQLAALVPLLSPDDTEAIARDLSSIATTDTQQTLDVLVPQLVRLAGADGKRRIVIATQFTEVAEELSGALGRHIGARRLAEHLRTRESRSNNEALAKWNADNECSVLVCDASAEEGLNLQRAELLVHLDLPWETFRVEQRIGRCDRHAPDVPRPIPSLVVTYGTQSYAQAWLELLSDGVNVFARSVSSLQYVLADLEATLLAAVLRRGFEAVEDATDPSQTSLEQELIKIKAHDALDSLQNIETSDRSLNGLLLASDCDTTMTQAFVTWLEGVGGRAIGQKPGVIRFERRRLQVPLDLEVDLVRVMGKPLALNRQAAVREQLSLPRAGHPQLDAVAEHLLASDRGVAFAVFRPTRGIWPPRVALRTDFLLTAQLAPEVEQLAQRLGAAAWLGQVAQESFPPTVVSLAMDPTGQAIPAHEVGRAYEQRAGDLNLTSRPDLFRRLTEHLHWEAMCATALTLARQALNENVAVIEQTAIAAGGLRRRVTQRIDQQLARRAAGTFEDDDIDLSPLAAALPNCINLSVSVLGCGAIISGELSSIDSGT